MKLSLFAIVILTSVLTISHAAAGTRVYLSGGIGCPLFTGGLAQISAQLEARGIPARVGCNFPIGDILAHRRDRVVLIGHSMGDVLAVAAARELAAKGMRVKVIALDPLYTGASCVGVTECICYYGQGWPMPGARNVFVRSSYGHVGFPADPRVQARVIAAVGR